MTGSASMTAEEVARAGARLDAFRETLAPSEQAALGLLLRRAAGVTSVLTPDEATEYERLLAEPDPEPGGIPALTVIAKSTRLCNLRCTYCHSWRAGPDQTMTFPVLARTIHGALRRDGPRRTAAAAGRRASGRVREARA